MSHPGTEELEEPVIGLETLDAPIYWEQVQMEFSSFRLRPP